MRCAISAVFIGLRGGGGQAHAFALSSSFARGHFGKRPHYDVGALYSLNGRQGRVGTPIASVDYYSSKSEG
jgi:hypothetical protein